MVLPGDEILALSTEPRSARGAAIVNSIRDYEAAEHALRGRLRVQLHVGRTELEAIRFVLRRSIRREATRPSDIARRLACTPAAATSMLKRLEANDLVVRSQDSTDGRSRLVDLTPATKKQLSELLAPTNAALRALLGRIGDEEADLVASYISDVAHAYAVGARGPSRS
jgi:DNA-binding MarR family transcriptional regulator